MLEQIFPNTAHPIRWFQYRDDETHRCKVEDFLNKRPSSASTKVRARMEAFAQNGNWRTKVGYIKMLGSPNEVSIYEVKSHQDRILFVRRTNDAVAIRGMVKKTTGARRTKKSLKQLPKKHARSWAANVGENDGPEH